MSKNKETTFQLTWRLFAICVLAAVLLGATYAITKNPIAEQDAKKVAAAQQEVIPEADAFKNVDLSALKASGWQASYDAITAASKAQKDGKTVGYIVNITATGYNPGIKMTVGISTEGKLKGVTITELNETAGLGAKAKNASFTDQYKNKSTDKDLEVVKKAPSADNQIEAITSSTITSKGVTSAVNTVIGFYKQYFAGKE